ncbi:hypothetical protein EVAR_13522_1 [Eumeta japonica]|uniref:Uncharacterized protein n=1 Tax=Eumeta variegata TaxID=151549 RepID=A0A4C1U8P8_EUMVA|nr:hypothetical protein EVAR_13522_1 [Eumeta japonica]
MADIFNGRRVSAANVFDYVVLVILSALRALALRPRYVVVPNVTSPRPCCVPSGPSHKITLEIHDIFLRIYTLRPVWKAVFPQKERARNLRSKKLDKGYPYLISTSVAKTNTNPLMNETGRTEQSGFESGTKVQLLQGSRSEPGFYQIVAETLRADDSLHVLFTLYEKLSCMLSSRTYSVKVFSHLFGLLYKYKLEVAKPLGH